MKLKSIAILLMICVMEAALGFGVMSVYSAYFKLPIDGCTTLQANSRNYYAGEEKQMDAAFESFVNGLSAFADEDGSLMLLSRTDAAGIALGGDTGWLDSVLISGRSADLIEGRGVIVSSAPDVRHCVTDGVFMRGKLDVRVVGMYDENRMPRGLRNMGFICLMSMFTKRGGAMDSPVWQIVSGTERVGELAELIKQSGYREELNVDIVSRPIGLFEGIGECFTHDDPFSADMRPTAYGILSLMLACVYAGLMLCRDELRRFSVRHIFGMSRGRMMLVFASVSLLTVVSGLALFFLIASAAKAFWFYEARHVVRFMAAFAVILLLLAAAVAACGAAMLAGRSRGGAK